MKSTLVLSLPLLSLLVARAAFAQTDAPPLPAPQDASTATAPQPPPDVAAAPPPAPTNSTSAPAPVSPAPSIPATAPPAPAPSIVELTSLRLMREKGIITQAEYDSAVHDLAESSGLRAPDENSIVVGKWSTTIYGFVEEDNIYDTTRSLNDLSGNSQIARAESQAGQNSRYQMGVRNSRFGLRLRAPEVAGIRTSAQLETDFFGTPLPVGGTQPYQESEGAFFTNPTLRVRHAYLKVETPIVDFLVGQTWQLFGWQTAYQPNTVEIQGVPGELYARTPQIRVSKTIHLKPVTLEAAIAASRPVSRDSGTPDGQAGLRFAFDSWKGVQTVGATGTQISPVSVAVTGLVRHVAIDQFSATPTYTNDRTFSAIAVDAFVPVIPVMDEKKKGNSLSLNGEIATGSAFADMYTGLTGGVSYPALPVPPGSPPGTAGAAFAADVDNGIVTYDAQGKLHGINWLSYLVGAQYYLPGLDGKMWVSANYSHMSSDNIHLYGAATKLRSVEDWFDVNLFVQPVPALRVGAEYANFNDQYVDGSHAINHRAQLSAFYVF